MKPLFLLSSKAGKAFMVACLSIIVLATSCGKKFEVTPERIGEASVRYVNASYGALPQDFYINGTKNNTSPVVYGSASESFTITSGVSAFNANDAGTTIINAITQVQIEIADKSSIFYYKTTDGKLSLAYLLDAVSTPVTGKANVRFINLNSSLNNQLSVSTVGVASPTIPSLPAQNVSGFFPVDAGAKFIFSATGVTTGAAFDGSIVAGKTYTIWIDGANATELTGHIFEQN